MQNKSDDTLTKTVKGYSCDEFTKKRSMTRKCVIATQQDVDAEFY